MKSAMDAARAQGFNGGMNPSRWVTVHIDLARVRQNVQEIAAQVGVPILAVVKSDAYGVGIQRVTDAISDLVEGWCVFSLTEAAEGSLWHRTGKPTLVLGPPMRVSCEDYFEQHVRPAVCTAEQAQELREAGPVLCVDTGMQRFSCPPQDLEAVRHSGACAEAFTHAVNMEQVRRFVQLCGEWGMRLHASGSSLLHEPQARLDAVRPGLAMYRQAVRVTTRLVEVHGTSGPAGYTGFAAQHHGIILCGYSNGLKNGICLVNGERRKIIEVGMQSTYVEIGQEDAVGDEVVLLGDDLDLSSIAEAWRVTDHAVLVALSAAGEKQYVG